MGLLAGLHRRAGSGCGAGRFGLAHDLAELLDVRVVVGQTADETAFAVALAGARVGLDQVVVMGESGHTPSEASRMRRLSSSRARHWAMVVTISQFVS